MPNNQKLDPGDSFTTSMPVALRVGNKTVRLQLIEEEDLASLPMATMAPGGRSILAGVQATLARSKMPVPSMEADL